MQWHWLGLAVVRMPLFSESQHTRVVVGLGATGQDLEDLLDVNICNASGKTSSLTENW